MIHQHMPVRTDEIMNRILNAFHETDGYATTGYLVDAANSTRPTVTKRLDRLYAGDCIEYIHEPTAFWRLKEDPRNNG